MLGTDVGRQHRAKESSMYTYIRVWGYVGVGTMALGAVGCRIREGEWPTVTLVWVVWVVLAYMVMKSGDGET